MRSLHGHYDADDPGVDIEPSRSHKQVLLPYLADDYILGLNGTIQVVIGVELKYGEKKGQEAKVFVWQPRHVQHEGVSYQASSFLGLRRHLPSS